MKKKFSKSWRKSGKPGKQRKYRSNAPKHIQGDFVRAHLSPELREKYGQRSLRLRKGDTVEVMRGDYKGEESEVELVDVERQKVYLADLEVTRRDGSKANPPVKPSNLKIIDIDKGDVKRVDKLGEEHEPEDEGEEDEMEEKDETEEPEATEEESEREIPSESTIKNMTKDEIKEYAAEEWDIELSTNDLKSEMVEQFFDEAGDKE